MAAALQSESTEIETVSQCLFCGSDQYDVASDDVRDLFFSADDGSYSFLRCRACHSLWLNPRPVGARLARAYAGYYTHAEPKPAPDRPGIRGLLRRRYLEARFSSRPTLIGQTIAGALRITRRDTSNIDAQFRFAPKAPARILDYGCGNGEYLFHMQPFGHELYGIEYDAQSLSNLARSGIVVEDVATLEDDRWSEFFDHATLAHVLEHVADPGALLSRLARWLKPGGTLFIEVPNADATGLAIFGRYWRGLEAPRHFALPTREALLRALRQSGFSTFQQHINTAARRWVWEASLAECPASERQSLQQAMATAPPENAENAEFLTFICRVPS